MTHYQFGKRPLTHYRDVSMITMIFWLLYLTEKCLTDEDYNKLQKCKSAAETTCNKLPGTISATYVEDTEGKYLILIDVYEFVKQGKENYIAPNYSPKI